MIVLISDNVYLKVAASCLLNNRFHINLFQYNFSDLTMLIDNYSQLDRLTYVFDFSSHDYIFIHMVINHLNKMIGANMKNKIVILDRRLQAESVIGNLYFIRRVDIELFEMIKEISSAPPPPTHIPSAKITKSERIIIDTLSSFSYNTNLSSRKLKISVKKISHHKCNFKYKLGFANELQLYIYIKIKWCL